MGIGCLVTIVATMMQTFAPRHNLACFMAGRFLVGFGQGMALSECFYCLRHQQQELISYVPGLYLSLPCFLSAPKLTIIHSRRPCLHR